MISIFVRKLWQSKPKIWAEMLLPCNEGPLFSSKRVLSFPDRSLLNAQISKSCAIDLNRLHCNIASLKCLSRFCTKCWTESYIAVAGLQDALQEGIGLTLDVFGAVPNCLDNSNAQASRFMGLHNSIELVPTPIVGHHTHCPKWGPCCKFNRILISLPELHAKACVCCVQKSRLAT